MPKLESEKQKIRVKFAVLRARYAVPCPGNILFFIRSETAYFLSSCDRMRTQDLTGPDVTGAPDDSLASTTHSLSFLFCSREGVIRVLNLMKTRTEVKLTCYKERRVNVTLCTVILTAHAMRQGM